MLNKMLVAVLVMAVAMASVSVLADGEYYEIGSNPMDASRVPNPATDAIVKLASDSPVVSMIGGGGVVATGKRLKAGELVVIDKTTHVAKWVARCGNEIVAPKDWIPQGPVMDLSGGPAQQATQAVAGPAPQAQDQQPQQEVQVDVNVRQDQQPSQPTYVQEAQPGFWDMVGMSFAQAFAQGLGEGLAYRVVWGGGPGYYGGYYAPVVYYPPAASVYGGDVFVTNVTKTVVVSNNYTTTNTNGGVVGGGPLNPSNPGSKEFAGGTGVISASASRGGDAMWQRQMHDGTIRPSAFAPSSALRQPTTPRHQPTSPRYQTTPPQRQPRQVVPRQNTPRYAPPSGGYQTTPPQRQPRQVVPRQNTPRYAPPSGGWQTKPQFRPAPAAAPRAGGWRR